MNNCPAEHSSAFTVLAVEDDSAFAEVLSSQLLAEGHRVIHAADGAAAVRAIFANAPNAVVMSLDLPDRDGYELARTICYLLKTRPYLIALAAATGSEERLKTIGFDLHLEKTGDPREIVAALRSLIGGLARQNEPQALEADMPALMPTKESEKNADRRVSRRHPPKSDVRVSCRRGALDFGANVGLSVLDLSETGVRLLIRGILAKGQEVFVGVDGKGHLRPVRRGGRVCWCTPSEGGHQVGIQFHEPLEFSEVFGLT